MTQYAIIIGISRYEQDDRISELKYAAKDAIALKQRLIELFNYSEENIFLFTHDEQYGEYGTHSAIIEQLGLLCNKMEVGDELLFYFAGHGVESAEGSFLLAANSNILSPGTIQTSSLPVSILTSEMNRARASTRVLFFDACRKNPQKDRGGQDYTLPGTLSREIQMVLGASRPEAGLTTTALLFGCSNTQQAFESNKLGHGVFTYYLIEGMEKIAKTRGKVNLSDLHNYVKDKVGLWSKEHGASQTPWIRIEGDGAPELQSVFPVSEPPEAPDAPPAPPEKTAENIPGEIVVKPSIPAAGMIAALVLIILTMVAAIAMLRPKDDVEAFRTVSEAEAAAVFQLDQQKRPIRYTENDFTVNGDKTVTDTATGLVWEQSGSPKPVTFNDALDYVAMQNRKAFAGYTDWRLPAAPELMTLLTREEQKRGMYIDSAFDPEKHWCWSSDRQSPGSAWLASFYGGKIIWDGFNNKAFVRCVREQK